MPEEAPMGRGWRCAADGRRFASESELQQKARGIINKLTHPAFETMVEQMSCLVAEKLQAGEEQDVQDIADALYNTAIEADSPRDKQLVILYARFTFAVCMGTAEPGKLGASPFRNSIVTKSQQDFETFQQQSASCWGHPDPAGLRRLSAGNINFIGQLYNHKLITDKVLFVVARTLAGEIGLEKRPPAEDNLELLFELLRASGAGMDVDNRETCDALFSTLTRLQEDESLSRRCRFRIQDILELRQRGWTERRRPA